MSARQKVLLVAVAVLLVGLYVVAVAGRRDDTGDPAAGPGALARLGRGSGTVDPATVAVTCLPPAAEPATTADGVRLAFGTACRLRVADPGALRTLVLRGTTPFEVTAPAPGDADVTVTDEVAPGPDGPALAKVAVDRETEVLLRCPGGGGCSVTLARS
ncbi:MULTISPECIES: hypothetical protein [unclassified Micromonospora]|uniref:hypothetical protein n=1 Tax=unclassified Micromonospora TaxID=2617518 RepID=UPI001C22E0ED|nr:MULTISPECIES: hypothetical protein [unclassified Micromonospora]MBU8861268.1 hypothetical protein [Micromonospora sp. WMMB482]MDM4780819.1 hypothetical protein [Micromonospora sp. b486]